MNLYLFIEHPSAAVAGGGGSGRQGQVVGGPGAGHGPAPARENVRERFELYSIMII
jgi:hypothetical protein